MKGIFSFLAQHSGPLLLVFYCFYIPLSWILVLRDGRAVYTILDFYPQLTESFKSIEPHLVRYGINSVPTVLFFSIGMITFSLYLLSLRAKMSLKKTIFWAIAFQAIVFFSYPSLSTDIFSYIFSDRIATVHHENVWKTKPITHSEDPFSRLSDWHNNTRVYGGVNQVIYTAPSLVGGNNLLLLVVLYKAVTWIFTLASMYIVFLLARTFYKGKETFALQLIFWNPLFLIEIIGSGHNDIIMIFFMLSAWYFFLQKKIAVAGILIALAFQVKIIAFVLFLFLLFALLKEKKYKDSIFLGLSFFIVNSVSFFFMHIDPLSFGKAIIFNTGVYWQGLPALLHRVGIQEKVFVVIGFLMTFIACIYVQYKRNSDAITVYTGFIVIYLLFFASAYWNWYVVWALAFIPFITVKKLRYLVLALSFTSFMLYPLYWIALRFDYQHLFWAFCTYIVMGGLPILVWFLPQRYTHYLLKD